MNDRDPIWTRFNIPSTNHRRTIHSLSTTSDTFLNESLPITTSFSTGKLIDRMFWKHESPTINEFNPSMPDNVNVNTFWKVPGMFSWPITSRDALTFTNSTVRMSVPISPVNWTLPTWGRFWSVTDGVDPISELTRKYLRFDVSSDYHYNNQESLVTWIDCRSGNVASWILTISNRGKFWISRDDKRSIAPFSIVMDWRIAMSSVVNEDTRGKLFCLAMNSVKAERSRMRENGNSNVIVWVCGD